MGSVTPLSEKVAPPATSCWVEVMSAPRMNDGFEAVPESTAAASTTAAASLPPSTLASGWEPVPESVTVPESDAVPASEPELEPELPELEPELPELEPELVLDPVPELVPEPDPELELVPEPDPEVPPPPDPEVEPDDPPVLASSPDPRSSVFEEEPHDAATQAAIPKAAAHTKR
jgi:fused signal recognition particle receptor